MQYMYIISLPYMFYILNEHHDKWQKRVEGEKKNTHTHHDEISEEGFPALPDLDRERPGIHAVHARYARLLQPGGEAAMGRPMAVLPRVGADDQSRDVYLVGFEVAGQSVLVASGVVRHAVVPDEGEGEHEYLPPVGRVGERLGISHHAGVEHHLAGDRGGGGAEGPAGDADGAIVQVQVGDLALLFRKRHETGHFVDRRSSIVDRRSSSSQIVDSFDSGDIEGFEGNERGRVRQRQRETERQTDRQMSINRDGKSNQHGVIFPLFYASIHRPLFAYCSLLDGDMRHAPLCRRMKMHMATTTLPGTSSRFIVQTNGR